MSEALKEEKETKVLLTVQGKVPPGDREPDPGASDAATGSGDRESAKEKSIPMQNQQGLNRRIMLALLLLMTAMTVIIVVISAYSVRSIYYHQYSTKAQDLVRMLADQIDGDWVREFSKSYEKDEYYEETKQYMDNIKNDFSGLQYLYIFKPEDTYFTYLIEAQARGDDPELIASPGWTFEYRDSEYENLVPDVKNKRASSGLILGQDAGYGKPISAWAPILDSNGEVAAMVEADYIIENIGKQITTSIAGIIAVQVLSILIVAILMIWFIRKNVVRPVTSLKKMVDSYESGEFTADLSGFRHEDEIRSLAVSFEDMTGRIENYISELTTVTAEKERIGAELNVATKIQSDMLPGIFPAFPDRKEFDLHATMDPAKEVGGDFYDFFLIDEDHLGLVMADVSGKGVPAALFMVIAKTLIKNGTLTAGSLSPARILEGVNDQLCEGNDADLFVTVWLGILEISTGRITYASAGHEYPAICREKEGFVLQKNKPALPLATFEGISLLDNEITLKKGEMLYLYTDGITEATSAKNELFGEKRMLASLSAHSGEDAEQLLKSVRKDIDMFVGKAPQFDDMTMLAIRYLGV